MGKSKVEEQNNRLNGSKKPSASSATQRFFSFHPTKEQKEEIRNDTTEMEDLLYTITQVCKDGCSFKIKYMEDHHAFSASLTESGVDFSRAITLSCFHSDSALAVRGLAYALQHVYPDFPIIPLAQLSFDNDW